MMTVVTQNRILPSKPQPAKYNSSILSYISMHLHQYIHNSATELILMSPSAGSH